MLTPQEVTDKKFKQAFVGGYDMSAVDDFLEALTEDYGKLYKENAVLKNKMKVLVDKLEEYRSNDASLRQAYTAITAQAEQMLAEAKVERERILEEAHREVSASVTDIQDQIAREEKRLAVTREQTGAFIAILKECYGRQIDQLGLIEKASMEETPRQKHDKQVMAAADQIAMNVAAMTGPLPTVGVTEPEFSAPAAPAAVRLTPAAVVRPEASDADFSEPLTPLPALPPEDFAPSQEPEPSAIESEDFPDGFFDSDETPPLDKLQQLTASATPEAPLWETDSPTIIHAQPVGRTSAPSPLAPPQDSSAEADEDLVFSIEQRLNEAFGSQNAEVDWTPEEISEVHRPTFDFSSLDKNFGHSDKGPRGQR